LRRPENERTLKNKKKAISYASFHALLGVYPDDKKFLVEEMKKAGYEPSLRSTDTKTPEGVGIAVAQAVLEYRMRDGANQLGDEAGGNGKPYADYVFYTPIKTADQINDPDHWQPIPFTKPDGSKITPGFLTPHWHRVKPFAIEGPAQFRPPPPPKSLLKGLDFRACLVA
jgi:hypothetical protein